MPRLLRSMLAFARSDGALALLNLLPCLIVCLWHLAVRPGFSVVIGDHPHHPALIGFHAPERSAFGVYRWSTPDAALLVPGHALPGVVSFVGVPAPDGTRVRLPFPGSAFTVELPQNSGAPPLRRYALLWPERAEGQRAVVAPIEVQPPWGAAQAHLPATLFFGAVAIPLEAQTPPVRAETRALGLLVTRLDVAPVRAEGRAPLALVLGVAATQFGYGWTAYRLFGWSGRRILRLGFGVGLALALAALWVQTQWVVDGIVFGLFVLALGAVATVAVIRMALRRRERLALLLGGSGLVVGGMLGFWFGAVPFLCFVSSVCAGIVVYVFRLVRRKWHAVALVVLFCGVVYVNGVSLGPTEEYQMLSENPFVVRYDIDGQNYWQENILLPLIAYFTRSNDRFSYNVLNFLIVVTSYALFCLISVRRYGENPAIIVTATLMTGQLSTIILSWLAKPDALTIILTIPLLFVRSPTAMTILSILGSLNHLVYVFSAFVVIVVRMTAEGKIGLSHLISVFLGGFLGYLLVKTFLWYYNIPVFTRIDMIRYYGLEFLLERNFRHIFLNILLLFGFQWVLILSSYFMFFSVDRVFFLVYLMLVVSVYFLAIFFLDFTRIFQVVIWGGFVQFVFYSYFISDKVGNKHLYEKLSVMTIVLSLVLPRFQSFYGSIFAAPFTLVIP